MSRVAGYVKMSCYIYCANYQSSDYGLELSGPRNQMRLQSTVLSNLVSGVCLTFLAVADAAVPISAQLLTLRYHLPSSFPMQ